MPGQPVAVPRASLTGPAESVPAGPVRLHPLDLGTARALLAGTRPPANPPWHPQFPMTDTLTGIRLLLEAAPALPDAGPPPSPWWLYLIEADGVVVGDTGFHGPPAPGTGAVVIGYQVVPARRGLGVATRACALLLRGAWAAGADEVWAEADPGNGASRAVLARNGFVPQPDGWHLRRRPG